MVACGHGVLAGVALVAAVAACFSPTPQPGLPCSASLGCPAGQTCDVAAAGGPTCVVAPGDGGDAAFAPPDADPTAPDGTMPIATGNDKPENAIDVGDGGTFLFDPSAATDDFYSPCTGMGGVDMFYKITLADPEVIYLASFGSDFDAVIAVQAGDCTPIGADEACEDDPCGSSGQAMVAESLPAGDHCIVVDHGGPTGVGSSGVLTVVRGGRAGTKLVGGAGTVAGNTCMEDNSNDSDDCGCEPGGDHHYFFTACPGPMFLADVDTCTGTDYDSVLQIRNGAYDDLDCTDDSCGETLQSVLHTPIEEPGLYWVIVDGCDDCGPYTLNYNF